MIGCQFSLQWISASLSDVVQVTFQPYLSFHASEESSSSMCCCRLFCQIQIQSGSRCQDGRTWEKSASRSRVEHSPSLEITSQPANNVVNFISRVKRQTLNCKLPQLHSQGPRPTTHDNPLSTSLKKKKKYMFSWKHMVKMSFKYSTVHYCQCLTLR